jgi:ribonucleotide monophosphatase NagD (HAD superfamily)
MVEYNIIATVGTSEVDLKPYPGGSATVPEGRRRKIHVMVLSNTSAGANTLTLRIYKGADLEIFYNLVLPPQSALAIVSEKMPILVVPSGRTLKAIASAESVQVLMSAVDE